MEGSVPKSTIDIYYEKGNFFRVIHVDGVLGGLTQSRNIFVSLYNQRSPLPQVVQQRLSPDNTLGDEVSRVGKTGVFREMEIGIVLTSEVAREIAQFLLQQAKLADEIAPGSDRTTTRGVTDNEKRSSS